MMEKNKYYLTQEGYKQLKDEYERLTGEEQPKILRRLQEERELGDLEDNPGFKTVREEQGLIEDRIAELEEVLGNYEIIEKKGEDFVVIGSRVTVEYNGGDIDEFAIVGSYESDPAAGKISNESPLGQALLGARVGETVEVTTPMVKTTYKLLDIK